MKFLAAFTALASVAAADSWSLYCGSSCSGGTLIASGSDFSAAPCTNLDTTYDYCYFESDVGYYHAVSHEGSDCTVSGEDVEATIQEGGCSPQGTWNSYQVVLHL